MDTASRFVGGFHFFQAHFLLAGHAHEATAKLYASIKQRMSYEGKKWTRGQSAYHWLDLFAFATDGQDVARVVHVFPDNGAEVTLVHLALLHRRATGWVLPLLRSHLGGRSFLLRRRLTVLHLCVCKQPEFKMVYTCLSKIILKDNPPPIFIPPLWKEMNLASIGYIW